MRSPRLDRDLARRPGMAREESRAHPRLLPDPAARAARRRGAARRLSRLRPRRLGHRADDQRERWLFDRLMPDSRRAAVVDFHIHCYDRPLRAPESFVAFMDRELAKTYGSFAQFLERYGSAESYLRVLDDAGADYGVIPAGSGTLEEVLPDDGQGRLLGVGERAPDRRHTRALRQE